MTRRLSRRVLALFVAVFAGAAPSSWAQDIGPSRAITMIVPISAGSAFDILARALAEGIAKRARQPVVVVNREGAGMMVGLSAVAKAPPDGYTIAFAGDAPIILTPIVMRQVPYKASDFEVICRTNVVDLILMVGPNSPIKSFNELIAAGRKNPGKLTYGTTGVGTPPHLLMEAIGVETGAAFTHIPYRAVGELAVQTMGGLVDFTVSVPAMLATNSARGMRGLATTGDSDMEGLPSTPQLRDQLGQKSPSATFIVGGLGVFAPKGLNPALRAWLRSACKSATEEPEFIAASKRVYTLPTYANGEDFQRAMEAQGQIATDLVRKLNIRLE